MSRQERYLELACKLSKKSTHHRAFIGCVIAHGKYILGIGFNKIQTHTKSNHLYSMRHAEFDSVLSCRDLDKCKGAIAYVYRENRQGQLAMSKPCISCETLLREVGIKKVIYTTPEGVKEQILK